MSVKFEIRKTSDLYGRQPPHEKAVCVNPECEYRDYEIEIGSLEELLLLLKNLTETSEIVLGYRSGRGYEAKPEGYYIEIYDDYRE